jgi:hypothetical protein
MILSAASPVEAKQKSLGTFGAWSAFSDNEGGQVVCYMVTSKAVTSVGPANRSPPYLMITHRPIEGSTDVFSYGAGTLLNTKQNVLVTVGKTSFNLFAVHDIAWARDALTDHRLSSELRHVLRAQTKATPAKRGGKAIGDVFDLTGAPAAYHAIGKACALPEDKPKPVTAKKTVKKTKAKKAVPAHSARKTP